MPKKSISQKRAQRQQQESAALNNIFNTFLGGLAAECYLFIVYRGYIAGSIDSLLAWDKILRVLMWIGCAVFVGGGLLALVKKESAKLRKIGITAASAGLFFAATSWIMTQFFSTGVLALCAAVPVLTVVTLIYFLYPRDCFCSTTLLTGTLFTIWVCERGLVGNWQLAVRIGAVAVLVGLVLFAIVTRRIQFNDGKFARWQIFPAECDYRVIYIVSVLCILLVALALFVTSISYYLIWAAVIALFAELAYYTTKLM